MEMKLTPRFYQNGERVFGPGVAELLKRVQEHHSLRAAAFSMEMALPGSFRMRAAVRNRAKQRFLATMSAIRSGLAL